MAKKTIDISGTATQMVGDINDNFSELYEGAGGAASVPTKRVKVYDVMTRCGKGVGPSTYIECNIKAGNKYVIEKSERGTNWQYVIIRTADANKTEVQKLLQTATGTTSVGGYDTEITITADASYFAIESYNPSGQINIYHYEDVPLLGASRWLGKRWLLIGDSISTEHQGIADVGYGELVAKSLGMMRENMAISGSTSVHWLDVFGYVSKQWSSYRNDYDLITVMLGTNDQGYSCPVGSLNDSVYLANDPSSRWSYYARMQLLYELLREKYPKSVIALITPIKRYIVEGHSDGLTPGDVDMGPYADAVRAICGYYSIPCIDIYNTVRPSDETQRKNFFISSEGYDGTHPNDVGHALFIAPIVEARLREIAPFYFNDWT